MEVLVSTVRQEKEIKGNQIGKEKVKLPLFPNVMVLTMDNPKEYTEKELVSSTRLQDIRLVYKNQFISIPCNEQTKMTLRI